MEGFKDETLCFFTSYFYDKILRKEWKEAEQWLLNISSKNIDIFEKKFLLLPIHYDVHWSLLVVVNAQGLFKNTNDNEASFMLEGAGNDDIVIFFIAR